jgi:hypothetical protein
MFAMSRTAVAFAALALMLNAAPARAQDEERPLCANRPGRGSPPCVLDAGRVQVEASAVDFTHDRQDGAVSNTTLYGDLALRFGVTSTGEAELAFSPYVRTLEKDAGGSSRDTGHGDLTLSWRQSLRNPDGSGLSAAIQPFVTAPTANRGFGAGGWQGGVTVPIAVALPGGFGLGFTPQIAAFQNADRSGAHLNATGVLGLSHPLGELTLGGELYVNYDADPSGHVTQKTFDVTGAWTPSALKETQFDVGLNAGLDRHAPDYEVYAGIAHRF